MAHRTTQPKPRETYTAYRVLQDQLDAVRNTPGAFDPKQHELSIDQTYRAYVHYLIDQAAYNPNAIRSEFADYADFDRVKDAMKRYELKTLADFDINIIIDILIAIWLDTL